MGAQINVSGVWKTPTPQINVAGVWKTPDNVKINVAGVWKEVWTSGPSVSATANGDVNYTFEATCYVGIEYNVSGVEYELSATTGSASDNMGNWLDSGTASEVWVEFIRTGGTKTVWVGFSNSTRYQLSSTRKFYITSPAVGYNTQNIIGYFRFWDAASGGNLLQTTSGATWQAEAEGGGGCPLCCFTPDTLITMGDGSQMPIGDMEAAMNVLCYNPETGQNESQPVTEMIVRRDRVMYTLHFEGGTTVNASDDHPFHVIGKGPASINPQGEYKTLGTPAHLEVGDYIQTQDGSLRLDRIEPLDFRGDVYTLGNSLFYANGLLVY